MNKKNIIKPELVRRFEMLEILPGEFNHRAHLEVATYYIMSQGAADASATMRNGLKRLLNHFGKSDGYKDDVTRFWIEQIAAIVQMDPELRFDEILGKVRHQLADPALFALKSDSGGVSMQIVKDLRYPIGKFQWNGGLTDVERSAALEAIAALPQQMRVAVNGLSNAQLDTPYRDAGWTIRQVVHHVADSHLNSYIRFRFALTEDAPTIQPYDEALWAELKDAKSMAPSVSLDLLDGLHARWVMLLKSFSEDDWQRTFIHPEMGPVTLERALGLYAWHGKHHLAHIACTQFGL